MCTPGGVQQSCRPRCQLWCPLPGQGSRPLRAHHCPPGWWGPRCFLLSLGGAVWQASKSECPLGSLLWILLAGADLVGDCATKQDGCTMAQTSFGFVRILAVDHAPMRTPTELQCPSSHKRQPQVNNRCHVPSRPVLIGWVTCMAFEPSLT